MPYSGRLNSDEEERAVRWKAENKRTKKAAAGFRYHQGIMIEDHVVISAPYSKMRVAAGQHQRIFDAQVLTKRETPKVADHMFALEEIPKFDGLDVR